MEEYISIELGRTTMSGKEIIVEFGRAICKEDKFPKLNANVVLKLDTKLTDKGEVLASVYIGGQLAAMGRPKFKETKNIIIEKIIDHKANTLGFTEGQTIELNKNDTGLTEVLNVMQDGRIVAHGKIVKGVKDDVCYALIV